MPLLEVKDLKKSFSSTNGKIDPIISISSFILQENEQVAIHGASGSGKTTFASFFINQLSKEKIKVLSPTFPIVNTYKIKKTEIWHYDLYRIKDKNECFTLDCKVFVSNN